MEELFATAVTCDYYCDAYGRNCYHLTFADGSVANWVDEFDGEEEA